MHEILRNLPPHAIVLDLGSAQGSFDEVLFPEIVSIRIDLQVPHTKLKNFVQANAAQLPFPAHICDAVICNHSLEHFSALDLVLQEIGRVLKPGGTLFASIPDCSTITDRLYRWLGRGGGHVNQLSDPKTLVAKIESATGLRHSGTRLLLTSLSFMNSRNPNAVISRGLAEIGNIEPFLVLTTWLMRQIDRALGTRTRSLTA